MLKQLGYKNNKNTDNVSIILNYLKSSQRKDDSSKECWLYYIKNMICVITY